MAGPRNATTTNRGRTYRWADEEFDSVTTIIGGGIPKPALKAWGERLVAETAVKKRKAWESMAADEAIDFLKRAPFRETEKAAAQGSDIHDWAEKYVLGTAPALADIPAEQQPYAQGFLQFLDDWHPTYEASEATVYNRRYGYAGTLDFIARIPGRGLVLGDYKTGKGVYGEVALQLAAYRFAEFVGLPNGDEVPVPDVDGCAVLHLTPTGYELIPVLADQAAFRVFLFAREIRRFCNDTSKQVLLAPLQPALEEVAS